MSAYADLIGFITSEPKIYVNDNGKEAARFDLTTSDKWVDKATKERHVKTQIHRIVVNKDLISDAQHSFKVNSKVFARGNIENRRHEGCNDGCLITEIHCYKLDDIT